MKSLVKYIVSIALLIALFLGVSAAMPTSASAKTYTNPKTLRRHDWYSNHEDVAGKWRFWKVHFAKHSVYEYSKTNRNGKWHRSHIKASRYFVRKANHKHWYTYGFRGSDTAFMSSVRTMSIKNTGAGADSKTHWTMVSFDMSNNKGGFKKGAPYKCWEYFTKMKYVSSNYEFYHEVNHFIN
ncbi:hypothetical protein [Levilactobacillus yonginensis]